ncbi:MAG: hypothetical protein ACI9U2_000734 [Bradymonadia bacterium]|jgi:hypothetical protein
MMRTNRFSVAFGLAFLGLMALSGCEDRNVSLQILQMEVDGRCSLEAAGGSTQIRGLSEGRVDLVTSGSYAVFPRVQNNMLDVTIVQSFRAQDGRIDTHDVVLSSATVRYTTLDPISVEFPETRDLPISGTIQVDGTAVLGLTVFTPSMVAELRQAVEFLRPNAQGQLVAIRHSVLFQLGVTLNGRTIDGTTVNSNEFIFPVRVCNGCLIEYPPEAVDTTQAVPNCLLLGAADDDAPGSERLSCQTPGTDNVGVDCRECGAGLAVDAFARQLCQPPTGLGL